MINLPTCYLNSSGEKERERERDVYIYIRIWIYIEISVYITSGCRNAKRVVGVPLLRLAF